ncbi:MAG TPA: adenylate/guanylate cyclase domain-containing protein [Acidimicrobiia bacterium]|nr:adenylate/guanylate cyclase domain-containing protein [Acidimicrobiia bacterium]
MNAPIIIVKQPNRKPLRVQVSDTLEVGRECDGLLVADTQTSRRHLLLTMRGHDVMVEDLHSTNGTFLDGNRIDVPMLLLPGSVVRIGDTMIELEPDVESSRSTLGPDGARTTTVTGGAPVRAAADGPAGARETSIDAVARSVRNTKQLLGSQDFEGTITIVFSDIESSTERATSMGDTAWMKVLNKHNEIVRSNVRHWSGHEVKNQGDGFMLTFPGARRALRCMIAVQQELTEAERVDESGSVRIRVGVHTGEVIAAGDDIFGRHVMVAARVAGQAMGREILVSALVHEIASARGDLRFGEPRLVALKGIEGDHLVYPLEWENFVGE